LIPAKRTLLFALAPALGALALVPALGAAAPGGGGDGKTVAYTFREAPFNARGVTTLEDLRGKPVLIDFWGTR
jgi:hypothetical protein